MRKIASGALLSVGFVLVLGAGGILLYTHRQEHEAEQYSAQVVEEFCQVVRPPIQVEQPAQQAKKEEIPPLVTEIEAKEEPPVVELDGTRYMGILSIPQLGLELPVALQMTDEQLRHTPAVFSGSWTEDDLIIGGHNYKSHFGGLHKLKVGDEISLIDTTGIYHDYVLTAQEKIEGNQLEQLNGGEWDLSLFTCIYGNNSYRTLLRFDRETKNGL